MSRWLRKISLHFAAGSLGGLVNSIVLWLFGAYGINAALNVAIHPPPDPWMALSPSGLGRSLGAALFTPFSEKPLCFARSDLEPGPHPGPIALHFPDRAA
jgi:hypothetical protein